MCVQDRRIEVSGSPHGYVAFAEHSFEQLAGALHAVRRHGNGFVFGLRIADVSVFMEPIHDRPVVVFPSTAAEFIFVVNCHGKQSENGLCNFVSIVFGKFVHVVNCTDPVELPKDYCIV